MSCPTIRIAPAKNPLPKCSPNLMPFHLNHSGTAPIATYFRIKPAGLQVEPADSITQTSRQADPETNKTDADTVAIASTLELVDGDSIGAAVDVTPSTPLADKTTTVPKKKSPLGARFVAAFRGRTVHGVTVALPEGYGGIVLRAEDDKSREGNALASHNALQEEASSKSKKGRFSRKSSRIDIDENVDMDFAEGTSQERQSGPIRTLNPTASFSSFVLWNPDLPVDEANDQYMRSLNEWTRLVAEIHRIEE